MSTTTSTGVRNQKADWRTIKALVLDLDGTLYHHTPVRRAMALRLTAHVAGHPLAGWRAVRLIRAYRKAQEILRSRTDAAGVRDQIALACRQTGCSPEWASAVVTRWMDEGALDLVQRHQRPGLVEFLEAARRRALRIGLFSDYPAQSKLTAMGLGRLFDVVRWAQEPEIGVFKPNPRGLLLTVEKLGVAPESALHIGDRADVDVEAARRAGMRAAIIGRDKPPADGVDLHVRSFAELGEVLGLT